MSNKYLEKIAESNGIVGYLVDAPRLPTAIARHKALSGKSLSEREKDRILDSIAYNERYGRTHPEGDPATWQKTRRIAAAAAAGTVGAIHGGLMTGQHIINHSYKGPMNPKLRAALMLAAGAGISGGMLAGASYGLERLFEPDLAPMQRATIKKRYDQDQLLRNIIEDQS